METKQTKRRASGSGQRKAAAARTKQTEKTARTRRQNSRTRRTDRVQKQEAAARTATAPRRERQRQAQPSPDVVYTPAKPFNRSRLLLQLATVLAVVLALTLGLSVFFKVKTITVSGAQKYSAWTVKEASGIEEGDNLLSFGSIKACGKIITALPYVESVRIGIKLPDTVNIEIKELDVAYSIRDTSGLWWLMTAEGKMVDQVNSETAAGYTAIQGVRLDMPSIGAQAVAAEESKQPTATDENGNDITVPITVTAQDKLNTALEILQYLEENGIIGQITLVNVDDISNLLLNYNGDQYTIRLGDTTRLSQKIELMYQAIKSLKEYDTGLLDASFDLMEGKVIYEPGETE